MPNTRPRVTTLAASLAAGLAFATPGPARAAGPAIGVAPIRLELAPTPGRPYTDALEVTNESQETAHVRVYAEDWRLERDGAVTFEPAGRGRRSASRWIRLNPVELDVPPGSTTDVRFTLAVPKGAPAGGYRTAIVVEQVPRPAPAAPPRRELAIRARIASVVYVRVGDPVPVAALHGVRYGRDPNGRRSLVVALENRGGVHFRTKGHVTLADAGSGRILHRIDLPDVPLLPESSREVRVPLPEAVSPGPYRTRTEVDIGRRELYVHDGRIVVD